MKNKKKNKGRKPMAEAKEKQEMDELTPEEKDVLEREESEPTDDTDAKVATLESKIVELEASIANLKDEELRRAADTENYKRRLRLDKENAIKYANEQLIEDLLTPLDNFSRAIEAANTTNDFEAMKQGVVMVEDQLLSLLKSKWGLSAIDAKGKEFDPNTMEAYSVQEQEGLESEIVLEEFVKGWTLNGKVLRSAKVMVGKPKKS